MTVVSDPRPAIPDLGHPTMLLVTRRDDRTREYHSLGFLSVLDGRFRFVYLRAAAERGLRALPGLSDLDRVYDSHNLFPVFAERLMSPRRPDRPTVHEALGLGACAEPFEVLARSGGRTVGDTIELVPVPHADPDGSVSVDFFVHGVRHMKPLAQGRIANLQDDEELRLEYEPDNAVNGRAVLVTDEDHLRLGYVPTPLLEFIHDLTNTHARVLRANGPEVGFHFRLLVRVRGILAPGHQPFTGPEWEPAAA